MADQTHTENPANPDYAAAPGSSGRARDNDTADALLRELAEAYGVDTSYWGWDGVERTVAARTLQDVLAALGVPANGLQEQQRSLAESRLAPWRRILPPVLVVREGRETPVDVHVPHGSGVRVWIDAEDGSRHDAVQRENWDQPVDVDGVLTGRATFAIPGGLGLGWHTLTADAEGTLAQCPLVVTPDQLRAPAVLAKRRTWGLTAQLYSVRSSRSWGIGDFADLSDLAAVAGEQGAGFVLVNPRRAFHDSFFLVAWPKVARTRSALLTMVEFPAATRTV